MQSNLTCEEHGFHRRQISWTAILIGALVCLGLSFLLNLFSLATSLSLATTDKTGMMTLAIGGFVGMAIGVAAVMFVSGMVAGYLGKPYNPKRNLGVVYGFATWSLALIITILLTSQIGRYINFYSDFVSNPTVISSKNYGYQRSANLVDVNDTGVNVNAAANVTGDQRVLDQTTQNAANKLGISSLLVFVLFFIGAFFSALGGHFGMTCECRKDKMCVRTCD